MLLQGERNILATVGQESPYSGRLLLHPADSTLTTGFGLREWLLAVRIPQGSFLDGHSLEDRALPATFGLSVLAIARHADKVERHLTGDDVH